MATPNELKMVLSDLLDDTNLKKMYVIVSKTNSVFNRPLTELPLIKKVISVYILSHPFLKNIPVVIKPNLPNASYNYYHNVFIFGLFNSSVIAHEIEHALSIKDSPAYAGVLTASKLLSLVSKYSTYPIIAGMTIAGDKIKSENKQKVSDIASLVHGLASLPTLYEEGKANVNAVTRYPGDKKEALKSLAPAYGTYLLGSALPIAMHQVYKKFLS